MSEPTIEQDPRVFFAAERTFLAWIRTGLALMGVGFAVARFSLFLREMQATAAHTNIRSTGVSLWCGVALVVVGVLLNADALYRYSAHVRQLKAGEWRPGVSTTSVVLAGALALIGVGMAVYLIVLR